MASKFQATVVSNEYINAVADSAATGKPIAYSGVVASSTVFTNEQLKTLDYAGAQSANKEITSVVTSSYLKQGSNTIVIEVNLSNENLSNDFQWASVLIYATYNGKNILVAVLRLVTPELFPAYDGKSIVSVGVDLFISVDKTAAANISVNGAGYATMDTVNKLRNYVDNDFNATIIRSDKDGVLNGSYSFSKAINALAGINGALNTRTAKFTDLATVAADMVTYAGNWYISNTELNNSPISGNVWALIEVIAGNGYDSGIIRFTKYNSNSTYYTAVNRGLIVGWVKISDDSTVIHNMGNENVDGIKTFIKQIIAQAGVKGNLQGNADTATKLATARRIGGQPFDGTIDVTLPGVNAIGNQNTTGNAATATTAAGSDKLNTGRNISVTGDVTAPAQKFDGTKDLSLVASLPTITRSDTSSNSSVGYGGTITVIDSVITDSKGRITGLNVSKISIPDSQTTVTGNAGSATKLQIARKIAGVSFDGTHDIDLAGVNKTGNQDTTGNAASATTINVQNIPSSTDLNTITKTGVYHADNTSGLVNSPTSRYFILVVNTGLSSNGVQTLYDVDKNRIFTRIWRTTSVVFSDWILLPDDSTLVHNTGSENVSGAKIFFDLLTAKSGIVGNVTGSLTGNADTATRLATARKIGGVSFNGTADIVLAGVNAKGNQDTTGNAATADVLNIKNATFTDISVVTSDMITYAGNWVVNSSNVNGIPSVGYVVIEVIPGGGNKTAGIIRMSSTSAGFIANYIGIVRNGSQLSWVLLSDDSTVVHNSGNETIGGSKTFSSTINGNLNGNSTTSTKLQTARTIGGVSFDGTQNINLPGVNTAGNQNTSGKAATAGRADTAAKADSATTANDPNALHQSGNETATGNKRFTGQLIAEVDATANGGFFMNMAADNNAARQIIWSRSDIGNASSGSAIGFGAGGLTVIGGGEATQSLLSSIAAKTLPPDLSGITGSTENAILIADSFAAIGAGYNSGGTTGKFWIFNTNGTVSTPDGSTLAEDNDVVHTSGSETISGDKTFTGTIIANNAIKLTSNSVSQAYTSSVNGLTFSLNRVGNTIMAQLYGKPSVNPGFGVTLATFTSSDIPFGYRLPNITGIQIYGSGDLQLSSDVIRLEKSPNSDDLKIVWRTNHSVQDFINFSFTWATIDDMPTNN